MDGEYRFFIAPFPGVEVHRAKMVVPLIDAVIGAETGGIGKFLPERHKERWHDDKCK